MVGRGGQDPVDIGAVLDGALNQVAGEPVQFDHPFDLVGDTGDQGLDRLTAEPDGRSAVEGVEHEPLDGFPTPGRVGQEVQGQARQIADEGLDLGGLPLDGRGAHDELTGEHLEGGLKVLFRYDLGQGREGLVTHQVVLIEGLQRRFP